MCKYSENLKKVLQESRYATIATVTPDCKPWNTPVIAAADNNLSVYWTSFKTAQHSKNITFNNKVFIVFYNSTTEPERTDGVYITAHAEEVNNEIELQHAMKILYAKKQKAIPESSKFSGDSDKRMYKAVAREVWINPGTDTNKNLMDPRIKVELC